ncbi:MAG TPA: C25 family cysteine peptidase, partial [Saprospiraceae bacterium]|nr:C25 family cysteine peptidase [Saprospiraceae bacterium]
MRTSFLLFILSVFLISSPVFSQMVVGPDTLVGNEWIQYGRPYYKFSLTEDGVYRITGEALQNAGINLATVNGSSIRMYALGKQVPVFLSTNGQFTTSDFIEFYGHKNRSELDRFLFRRPESDMLNPEVSMYTDKSSYYLSFDGEGTPVRVSLLTNDVTNPPAASGYFNYPEQLLYSSNHFDPYVTVDGEAVSYSSFMHAEGFSKGSEPNTAINISAIDRAASGPDAVLHIRMATTNNGAHSFPILWNEQPVVTIHRSNIQIVDTILIFPLNQLQDNNVLRINSDVSVSRFTLVSVTLTYLRSAASVLSGETSLLLPPHPQGQYFVFENFTHGSAAPILYTSDGSQRMTTDFNGQNQVHFLWPTVQTETELRLVNPETEIHFITALEQKEFSNWAGDNTQYIIITHPDLMEPGTASEYVQYRSSVEGGAYLANAYSILDIYDQFGYGVEKHPQSIRNFVEFVHRHWPAAKMIFIVGRGIEYDRSRFENGTWESSFFVPTFGKPGSDQLLTATLWDLIPRYPLGRLAVTDAATIHTYLNKVKEHDATVNEGDQTIEDKEWIKHVIHISGGMEASEQEEFKSVMSALGQQLAATDFGAEIFSFAKTSSDFIGESQSRQIEKLLHEGSSIINYLGHSSTSTFEFNIQDPTQWENKGHYPIFSGMGCSAGAIFSPSLSLSDRYVLIPDEGAIAFISGSGSQFASSLITWAEPWYQYFGAINYGTTLGLSVLHGLRIVGEQVDPTYNGTNYFRYLLEQQTLQGDPAIKINPLPGPDYVVDRNSVVIAPALLNTRQDSFNLQFSIANIGRNLHQYVTYTVTLQSSGNNKIELIHGTQLVDQFKDSVSLRLPLLIDKKPGVYRLLISLDDENLVHELPAPDAESNNKLLDNLGVEGISLVIVDNLMAAAYPPNYAIVNQSPVELVATGSNAFIEPSNVIVEIDTNGLFNSPYLIHKEFPGTGGTLKYSFDNSLIPGQEYFWRISTDSISPEQGYLWSKRSFTYLPDKSHGWSQSHFHQFTDDRLYQITADSAAHHFDFARKVKNYTVLNRFHD